MVERILMEYTELAPLRFVLKFLRELPPCREDGL